MSLDEGGKIRHAHLRNQTLSLRWEAHDRGQLMAEIYILVAYDS